jgi:hypothetical protein
VGSAVVTAVGLEVARVVAMEAATAEGATEEAAKQVGSPEQVGSAVEGLAVERVEVAMAGVLEVDLVGAATEADWVAGSWQSLGCVDGRSLVCPAASTGDRFQGPVSPMSAN